MRAYSLGVVIILVILCMIFRQENTPPDSQVRQAAGKGGTVVVSSEQERPKVRFLGENPFTQEYGEADGDTKRDLEALRDVVISCQLLLKNFDSFHLPGNPEIVRFLQGENPEKLAWIPAKHRLIQSDGVLLDRNGNPVFFHRLSGLQFEYRSAGADGEHWTNDDIVVR